MSVQLIAVIVNIALAVLKFTVGTIAGSRALIADAFNSAGDILATSVAWFAFRVGRRPPDANHPYGHENAEALAGLVIGAMLVATGAFIAIDSAIALLSRRAPEPPEVLALWAAGITAITKELLYRVSMREARRTNSPTLLSSARDHRADVLSATVALLGIALSRLGPTWFDAGAGTAIGIYIFVLGIAPVRSNVGILMHEMPPDLAPAAARAASGIPGVHHVVQVRALPTGGSYRMDMIIEVDGALSVAAAHDLAHAVEGAVLASVPFVREVHVHVEPG
jgi:cation diffusion facilitator family transporter